MGSASMDLTEYLKKTEAADLYGTKADVEQLQEDDQLIYVFDE